MSIADESGGVNGSLPPQRIDLNQAARFLNALAPGETVCFQVFKDDKNSDVFPGHFSGTLEDCKGKLLTINRKGGGCFVTVNETDGKGRKAENVTKIRALFLDLDGSPLEPVVASGVTPHIITETSLGKFHICWLVADCPVDRFKPIQGALAKKFSGDPSVKDPSRVLRIPGFLHQKAKDREAPRPFQSRIVGLRTREELPPYDVADIVNRLGLDLSAPTGSQRADERPVTADGKFPASTRNDKLCSCAGKLRNVGLEGEALFAALQTVNQTKCDPPETEERIREIADWIDTKDEGGETEKNDRNQFQRLLELFYATGSSVFLDQHGTGWTAFNMGDHTRNILLGSSAFHRAVLKSYVDTYGTGVSRETTTQVGDYLAASATGTRHLYNRFAYQDGALLIDMGTPGGEVITVNADGWEIATLTTSPFRRYSHQHSLPEPARDGDTKDLNRLLSFIPVKEPDAQILILVWLITLPLEHIPRPGVILHGTQGGGKSTVSRMCRTLWDPSSISQLSLAKDHAEFVQQLDHHAVPVLDNLHRLPQWASDDLCSAVTGGGFSKRKLYSDEDDVIFQFKRTFILNGINIPGTAPDLLDRSILIGLDRIAPAERRDEKTIEREFTSLRPRISGAMLNVLSNAMGVVDGIRLDSKPRMADWALWGCAVADALGAERDHFLNAYSRNIGAQNDEVLTADPVAMAVTDLVSERGDWSGTPSDLYHNLTTIAEKQGTAKDRGWPKAPQAMTRRLRILAHNLREAGVTVKTYLEGRGASKRRCIAISNGQGIPEKASPASPASPAAPGADKNGNGMGTVSRRCQNSVPNCVPDKQLELLSGNGGNGGNGISGTIQGADKGGL